MLCARVAYAGWVSSCCSAEEWERETGQTGHKDTAWWGKEDKKWEFSKGRNSQEQRKAESEGERSNLTGYCCISLRSQTIALPTGTSKIKARSTHNRVTLSLTAFGVSPPVTGNAYGSFEAIGQAEKGDQRPNSSSCLCDSEQRASFTVLPPRILHVVSGLIGVRRVS